MRYLVAIICAVVGALLATMFISSTVATKVVSWQRFNDPDEVATMHATIFMAINTLGLLIGWAVGWLIGRRIDRAELPPA
jgi:phosphate/sulfate permease